MKERTSDSMEFNFQSGCIKFNGSEHFHCFCTNQDLSLWMNLTKANVNYLRIFKCRLSGELQIGRWSNIKERQDPHYIIINTVTGEDLTVLYEVTNHFIP